MTQQIEREMLSERIKATRAHVCSMAAKRKDLVAALRTAQADFLHSPNRVSMATQAIAALQVVEAVEVVSKGVDHLEWLTDELEVLTQLLGDDC